MYTLNNTSFAQLNHSTSPELISSNRLNIYVQIPIGIVMGLISLTAIAGNMLVILAFKTDKGLRTVSDFI